VYINYLDKGTTFTSILILNEKMKLLEQVKIGNQLLKNSMAMAPMTRSRADFNGVVGESTVLYYTQRASAGLIISEAINISRTNRF
jgi:N-ethylmaleimide reductase